MSIPAAFKFPVDCRFYNPHRFHLSKNCEFLTIEPGTNIVFMIDSEYNNSAGGHNESSILFR
jgi:hypothetical protein